MMPMAERSESIGRLDTFIRDLGALTAPMSGEAILNVLARSGLDIDDVASFVGACSDTYSRRRVARTDAFEVLVMTWLPGQGAGAHDHAGSVSVFKILQGAASETRFAQA